MTEIHNGDVKVGTDGLETIIAPPVHGEGDPDDGGPSTAAELGEQLYGADMEQARLQGPGVEVGIANLLVAEQRGNGLHGADMAKASLQYYTSLLTDPSRLQSHVDIELGEQRSKLRLLQEKLDQAKVAQEANKGTPSAWMYDNDVVMLQKKVDKLKQQIEEQEASLRDPANIQKEIDYYKEKSADYFSLPGDYKSVIKFYPGLETLDPEDALKKIREHVSLSDIAVGWHNAERQAISVQAIVETIDVGEQAPDDILAEFRQRKVYEVCAQAGLGDEFRSALSWDQWSEGFKDRCAKLTEIVKEAITIIKQAAGEARKAVENNTEELRALASSDSPERES